MPSRSCLLQEQHVGLERMQASIAEAFFFEELSASAGRRDAQSWLTSATAATDSADSNSDQSSRGQTQSKSVNMPSPSTPSTASGIQSTSSLNHTVPQASAYHAGHDAARLSELARNHGESAGLIYTDAAHILVDRSSRT